MKSILRNIFMGGLVFCVALILSIPSSVEAAEKSEIVFGAAVATTGKFSTEGSDSYRGMQLWIEDVNAGGGIFVKNIGKKLPVRLIMYDDQSDASTCAKLYERLITVDNVDLLLPPWGSGNTFAATVVMEKHKYPTPLGSAATEKLYERGFKYIFETCILTETVATPGPDYLATIKDKIKGVAVLYENFIFTLSIKEFTEKKLKEKGFNIVLSEMYPLAAKEFSSVLVKVKSLNPDAIILVNLMPASLYFTRQMNELGIKPKFYLMNIGPIMKKEFIDALGPLSENIVENSFWHPDMPYKGAKEVGERYVKRFNRIPNSDAMHSYMAGQVLQQGIEKAGTLDREKLNEVLHSADFYTVGGPLKYNEAGINIHQTGSLIQVQNGQRALVWPPNLANKKMIFPFR